MLSKLFRFTQRYGPEWGSGGIFGLRYHKGVLYFTLAFEAESYFVREDRVRVYRFEHVGPGPCSGGDTYNAVAAVDDFIYFGGWVHAPARYEKEKNDLKFYSKYSHVHVYDIREDAVRLVWKESIHDERKWAGEISEIIYDEVNDRLLLARADGHVNLGVYELNRKTGEIKKISSEPALKGTIFLEYACFNTCSFPGFQLVNMTTGKVEVKKIEVSVDGGPLRHGGLGPLGTACNRVFSFVKGGVYAGNPVDDADGVHFFRLLDFGDTSFSPFRVNALPVGGGLLIAYNALPDMLGAARRPVVAPTLLVYITPPVAKVVGVLGARVTSLEKYADKILVACGTAPNLSLYRATPLDTGCREILALPDSILASAPPPFYASFRAQYLKDEYWGGIPLTGYREAYLVIKTGKSGKVTVCEYDFALPPIEPDYETYELKPGKNVIDLSAFKRVVSFRTEGLDPKAVIRLVLC